MSGLQLRAFGHMFVAVLCAQFAYSELVNGGSQLWGWIFVALSGLNVFGLRESLQEIRALDQGEEAPGDQSG